MTTGGEPAIDRESASRFVTGIVLAGGRSSRFGSDKLVALVDGRPLIHHSIRAVAAVAERIVVVAALGAELPLPDDLETRITVIHDPEPFGGPLVGLAAALGALDTAVALVVGGDMPWMVPSVLRRLIGALEPPRRAVVLEVPGRFQPLPMALEVAPGLATSRLVLARGERSLRDLLFELGSASIPAPVWLALDPAGATITDIDRPSDLRS